MSEGAEVFNDEKRVSSYQSFRHRASSPNESLEKPIILELLGDVSGEKILDLGCGDALFARDLLLAGAQSYLGVEASQQMVQLAQKNLQDVAGEVVQQSMEDWSYPAAQFDLVVSRLALHYVADLEEQFGKVNRTLKSNGRFIFSIVHPVITSSDKSRAGGGLRQDWIVDDYFSSGPRKVFLSGVFVKQYHHTVEEIFISLQRAGFFVEQLRESRPQRDHFTDADLYERRKRIPLFLFFAGVKRPT